MKKKKEEINTVADLKAKLAEFPDDYPLHIFKSDDDYMFIRDIVDYDDTCEIELI